MSSLRRSRGPLLAIALIMAIGMIILGLALLLSGIVHNLDLSSFGVIRTVGVRAYWDAGLKDEANEVKWGTLYIGVPRNITLYLHSVSNVQVTLGLKTWNWTLINSDGNIVSGPNDSTPLMNFTWSYGGQVLHPNDTISVTMTLLVDNKPDLVDFILDNDVCRFTLVISITPDEQI